MPLCCGRYLWDDERVTVWMQNGEMIAALADGYMDTPEEIDRMFRDDNSENHQTSPELPWLLISECCEDECSGHNEKSPYAGATEKDHE